jgi:hypothetical protein
LRAVVRDSNRSADGTDLRLFHDVNVPHVQNFWAQEQRVLRNDAACDALTGVYIVRETGGLRFALVSSVK